MSAVDAQVLHAEPGDTIAVRVPGAAMSIEALNGIARELREQFPENRILILGDDMEIAALRPSPSVMARAFHEAFDLVARETPQVDDIPLLERELRVRLLLEEVAELVCAIHGLPDPQQLAAFFTAMVRNHTELADSRGQREPFDVVEVAHESADVLAVVFGAALHYGFDLDAAYAEVAESAMRKRAPDGTVRRRDDGKVLKPEGWQPPDVASAIGLDTGASS